MDPRDEMARRLRRRGRLRTSGQFAQLALREIGPQGYLNASAVVHPDREWLASSTAAAGPARERAVQREVATRAVLRRADLILDARREVERQQRVARSLVLLSVAVAIGLVAAGGSFDGLWVLQGAGS